MKTDHKKARRVCMTVLTVLVLAVGCAAIVYLFFPQVLPSEQTRAQLSASSPSGVSHPTGTVPANGAGSGSAQTDSDARGGTSAPAFDSQNYHDTTRNLPADTTKPVPTVPQITPVSEERYLTADTPVRSSASDSAANLGTATKNTLLRVKGYCSNGWAQVIYKNKNGYVPAARLTDKAPAVQKTGPYLIKVNRTQNLVTVYKKDSSGAYTKPHRAMVCSVGTSGNTPCGTFATTDRYTWRLLEGNVYGQYATRITGHILFHSVPYYTKDKGDLESAEYNKLGTAASLGCVRLSVKDAKWIYDNCPKNTAVVIYDSDAPEPLEKPKPIRIDLNDSRSGWDPTDPDPQNPWNASSAPAE